MEIKGGSEEQMDIDLSKDDLFMAIAKLATDRSTKPKVESIFLMKERLKHEG